METYDLFTSYYDEVVRWETYDLDDEVYLIEEFIEKFWEWKKSILEFACWTGIVWKELQKKFEVFWMDINEKMVKKAEENMWKDNIQVWDMTNYKHKSLSDIILCNYNSVCHLLSEEKWLQFFNTSYENLKDDWILIFDINTLYEFDSITRDFAQFFNIWDDTLCLEMFKKWDIYEWLVKMFIKEKWNKFVLKEEVVREISFEIDKIKGMLEKTWFKILHLEDFHKIEVDETSERVYFIAQKCV